MMASEKLRIAVFLSKKRGWEIAHEAVLHPSMLSKILHGIEKVKSNDPRVLRVAKVVGIPPEECFVEVGEVTGSEKSCEKASD